MPENYTRSFRDMLDGKDWAVREYRFYTEVAFLVTKGDDEARRVGNAGR
jgi:hypothetical protein